MHFRIQLQRRNNGSGNRVTKLARWREQEAENSHPPIRRKQEVKNASGARLVYLLKVPQPVQTAWGPRVPVESL